ncbi:hypothetical protein F7U66_00630 [Vibrio parahaemolyticus]|nr:hypothetical protein [Vibrio parahaemolyticus]
MSEYFGAATLTAPRAKCILLAEFSFCLYLKGYTLKTHDYYGANTAMIWGAELAQKTKKMTQTAVTRLQKPLDDKELSEQISGIKFLVCWSPDGAKEQNRCTKKSGRLKKIFEILNLNSTQVLNTHVDYTLIEQLREEVLLEHGIRSEETVKNAYAQHMDKNGRIVKKDWLEVINEPNTIAVLMKDCTHLSPPYKNSRAMYGALQSQINSLITFEQNPINRLGTFKINEKGNIAIVHTVRSYGLYARNYCDYFTIRKALTSFAKANKGKTLVFPYDNAGLNHADIISVSNMLKDLKDDVAIELNIFN